MKSKFYYAVFIGCFWVMNAIAQKKQNVYFLKDNGQYVDVKDSADFVRIVSEPDQGTTLYNVLEYYLNGNTKTVGKSSAIEPIKLEGTVISCYPNKKKKQVANYQKGKFLGFVYDYYPNRKLYRSVEYKPENHPLNTAAKTHFFTSEGNIQTVFDSAGVETVTNGNGHYLVFDADFKSVLEEGDVKDGCKNGIWKGFSALGKIACTDDWASGKFVKGVRTTNNGDTINYTIKEALPIYEGGDMGFGSYLAKTMRYPKVAKDQGLEGTVIAGFLIDENGNVTTARILKSLPNETDQAVIQTFKAAKKWKPAVQNGLAVPMEATVAVTFRLPNPTTGNIIIDEITWNLSKNP